MTPRQRRNILLADDGSQHALAPVEWLHKDFPLSRIKSLLSLSSISDRSCGFLNPQELWEGKVSVFRFDKWLGVARKGT